MERSIKSGYKVEVDRICRTYKGRIRRYLEEVYEPDAVTDLMVEEELRSLNELLELYLEFCD